MEKFEIIKMPDPRYVKSNRWFVECERNLQPFVIIKKKTKFCELHWDFISATDGNHHFSPDDDHNERIFKIMQRYWTMKRKIWIYGPVATLYRITLEQAEKAAVEIFDELAAVPLLNAEEYRRQRMEATH